MNYPKYSCIYSSSNAREKRGINMFEAPKNKQELFVHLDNAFETALKRKEQKDVWLGVINQSLKTNLRLGERIGKDQKLLLSEYIEDRAKILKAD